MAERCLNGIPREPDFFHFLILPFLGMCFLLMDKEAFQTPPSPFVCLHSRHRQEKEGMKMACPLLLRYFPRVINYTFIHAL